MILIACATAIWGTIGIAVALLYRLVPADPFAVSFWRLVLSAPALWLLCAVYVGPNFWRVARRDWLPLGVMGVAFASYQITYFAAIPRIGVAAAVLVNICSAPVFVAILSSIFLKEPFTWALGVVLVGAVIGTVLLVGGTPQADSLATLLTGGALALGAGFSYSLVVIATRRLAGRYHPVQPITLAFTLSALLLVPFALWRGVPVDYPLPAWGLLVYLGVVPTAIGYWLYMRGMQHTPATVAAILTLLEPLGSTVLAVLLLGESLSPTGLLGGVILLVAVGSLYRVKQPGTVATARPGNPSPS